MRIRRTLLLIGFLGVVLGFTPHASAQHSYTITYDAAGRATGVSINGSNAATYSYADNGALSGVSMTGTAPFPESPVIDTMSPSSGPSGTVVTLIGRDFTGTLSVTINGVALTNIAIVSDTEIQASIPAGSSSGRIAVTNQVATTETSNFFINTEAELPAPTGLQASDGTYSDKIALSWPPVVGATGYDLYRREADSNAEPIRIQRDWNNPNYEDATVFPETVYLYWVKARNSGNLSAWSGFDSGFATTSVTASRLKWSYTNPSANSFRQIAVDPSDETVFVGEGSNMRAIASNGTEKSWSPFTAGDDVESMAVFESGSVYFNTADNFVYKLGTSTGAQQWQSSGASPSLDSWDGVFLYNTSVITPDYNNDLIAYNKTTGVHQWSIDLPITGYGRTVETPVLGQNGKVYMSGDSGRIAMVDISGASPVYKWSYPAPGAGNLDSSAHLTIDGSSVYAALSSGKLLKLQDNGTSASLVWETVDLGSFQTSASIAPNGNLYLTDFDTGKIYSINPSNGVSQVIATIGSGAGQKIAITEDGTLLQTRRRTLHALDLVGTTLWTYELPSYYFSSNLAYHNGVVHIASDDYKLHAIYVTLPPSPPADVVASNGEFSDKVQVSWNLVDSADSYKVYRHTSNDPISATLIASNVTTTSYDDFSAQAGATYFYWVSTVASSSETDKSNPDLGYRALEPIEQWRNLHFGLGTMTTGNEASIWGDSADPDGDQKPNLLEYGLGLNPWVFEFENPIAFDLVQNGADRFFELTFTRRRNDPSLSVTPEFSGDLETWADILGVDYEQVGPSTILSTELEELTFRDKTPNAEKRFGRVKVQK